MQASAIQEKPLFFRRNSLECNCEKNSKTQKIWTFCDICSEHKFLKKTSVVKFDENKISTLDE